MPPGYYWKWGGQFENQQRATKRLSLLVPVVLFAMFVMIYLGLGKWWLAFVVFFRILVSASGGFVLLLFYGANLSVAVWVGFIVLFGVADDASVVILSFLENTFRDQHPNSVPEIRALVIEATLKRVRPMLMSTATTVIGLMPIFLTHGRGSDVMQPMAVPSVGSHSGTRRHCRRNLRAGGAGRVGPHIRCLDVAMQSSGITLVSGDRRGIANAIRLSRATRWNIRENLVFAFL